MSEALVRCPWSMKHGEEIKYHDEEWGVPRYDDAGQFEFLTLEAAQAGLSWRTILLRRDGYRRAFADFDPVAVAEFGKKDVERLLGNTGIIRNRKKIESAISNARCFLEVAARHGSFSAWLWNFVDGRPIQNVWQTAGELPAVTPLSELIAKDLKKLGFSFLGPTVVYAHLQATGLVNDHLVRCFRHVEVQRLVKG